ncbi:MAG: LacI family DNA-binding transcriptional regulator [Actinomyces succiniciruminis]|uniref:HTH-type transcriptional regulator CelR n=1 Tax=Actinomyces succiniciruminis TaxID=1522002 RepID=A0A1L7RQ90_9ACTO|nr:LacI family DNA-binding transcriptional regulator [Actinomyces succiniciruminis]MBM6980100.1 LacI family DNA-binding transcriptional regulator [Actinomyces succiniciruminis]CED92420.1 HTH-type transcriptional regulator CelR [Actinomyces succiniciruminis]
MRSSDRVTLEDVARAAGVSRATASRVVRGDTGVTAKKMKAVRAAVDSLGYIPNSAARALVSHRTGTVAVVIPEPDQMIFSDPFLTQTVLEISSALDAADIQLVMVFADQAGHGRRAAKYLRNGSVDGAIVISHHRFSGQVEAIVSTNIPVVFIGRPVSRQTHNSWVDLDNVSAGRLAAVHLLDRGVRRPAIITGPLDMVAAHDRLRGFRDVMAGEGIDPLLLEGAFTSDSGRAAGEALAPRIESGEVDGVFASSDLMALEALRAWRERGLRVPDDVALVSCDNTPQAAAADPPLSSIDNPTDVLGRTATDMLRSILDETWDGQPVLVPARLVVRGSC